ncbi:MAG: hypothetical protein FWC26_14635 [Fibromonadales bacterium]|nr:hypothetical protein [Fibromonadales bacterium]
MRYFAFSSKILLCLLWAMAFFFVSCEDKAPVAEETEVATDEYIEPALEQFKEPDDLKITHKKARNFNKASEALVIMGQEWSEAMAEVDDEEKLKMLAIYEKAQDDLIRKFGIAGKDEFMWIQTKALPEPSNKSTFAKAGVWSNR